ncbi:MAG: alpha-glucosidase [Marinilabiliaceae bacterium]|nr:alpha-glucosidase [Marinilabiliaceae bacterium]
MKKSMPKKFIWWKHGVVYHIYPRSFYDSNDDGIGDIKGIIHKLDYLKDLGVDAIWLSPIYLSPQIDFGYDVSDYRQIDPIFGTLKDFRKLLEKAHKRNMRVIMDLIMNHTSDQHPWFIESSSASDHEKRDWYIWRSGKNGKPPNNWSTCFGGSAWEFHPVTNQYYYHSFFKEQPDLNWRNEHLRNEFFDIVKYWLDMGVDGFRLDVANLIVKDKKLRDNPGFFQMLNQTQPVYTRNRPKSIKTLKLLRKLIDKYDNRMCVGEIYTLPPGDPKLAASYLGSGKNTLNLAFDFSLIFKRWNAKLYGQTIKEWMSQIPAKGWPCNVLSNHDLFRSYNRPFWRLHKRQKAIVAAFLLLTLKGTPFIYYGEEIGMQNSRLPRRFIKDPIGKRFWPFYSGRDKARSPMQWNKLRNSGFSRGEPWLPVNRNYYCVNVESLKEKKGSILYFYRQLLKIRRKNSALYAGEWEFLNDGKNGVLVYKRFNNEAAIVVCLNFTPWNKTVNVGRDWEGIILLSTHKVKKHLIALDKFSLLPFESLIVEVINS